MYLECLITLRRSLLDTLKSKGPETETCAPPKVLRKVKKKCLKCVQSCRLEGQLRETSLRNSQKAHGHQVREVNQDAREEQKR